jgi:hypothetical protein
MRQDDGAQILSGYFQYGSGTFETVFVMLQK